MRGLFALLFLCACEPPAPPPQTPITAPMVATPVATAKPKDDLILGRDAAVEVEWHGTWYAAVVLDPSGDGFLIHYDGYSDEWDEVVPRDRIRMPETP